MTSLVAGLLLFLGVHSVRMVAPAWRGSLGAGQANAYRAVYAAASLAGLVLVASGFGAAARDPVPVYFPPGWLRVVTQVVMVPALVLAVASVLPTGDIKQGVRHPLLIAAMLWAVGHLLANGDLAGIVLFGGFLAWATLDLAIVWNRSPLPVATENGWRSDLTAIVGGLVLYGLLVAGLHAWLFGRVPL